MFVRMQVAFALALLAALILCTTVLAKGGFDFIAITGPNLKETVHVTDTALTEDFFTFANFYEDKTKAPDNPGEGYEILRGYVDGRREIIFDRLHYYPETGFVFYDGIENGESEYDGDRYRANPEIRAVFESVLGLHVGAESLEKKGIVPSAGEAESKNSTAPSQPGISNPPSLPVIIIAATGLAVLIAFAFGRRKPFTR